MNEEIELYLETSKDSMEKSLEHLDHEFAKVRAGKANPRILEGVLVDYYGTETDISKVSNISTSDSKTIVIQPWEKSMIAPIEKAILKANLNLTPSNNGEIIRIIIPPLTEERRRSLVKEVKNISEQTKIGIRSARKDVMDELKKMKKDGGISEDEIKDAEDEVQKLTNQYIEKVDAMLLEKENEIMTV